LQNINAVSLALLALAVLLPGCANSLSHKQEIARQHLSPGYLAEPHYTITSPRESWTLLAPSAFHLDNKPDQTRE
jgi:outer membrane PBP1 activator LpoA protein